ncbi:hypothetical protein ACSSS7_003983 [Eimeria intestinalis]
MKYSSAAFAALALRTALQLPSCLADQPPSEAGSAEEENGRAQNSMQVASMSVKPTSSSRTHEKLGLSVLSRAWLWRRRREERHAQLLLTSKALARRSCLFSPASADDALVASIEAAVAESHVAALQDPALHCSSAQNEYTHFCRTLREFAAAALVSQQLEKKSKRLSVGFGKSKKSTKELQSPTSPSMVQLPSVEEQTKKNDDLAKEYAANVAAAREKASDAARGKNPPHFARPLLKHRQCQKCGAGSLLGRRVCAFAAGSQAFIDPSVLRILDVMLLAGMAKQLLHELFQVASSAPEGSSISLDMGEVEGVLRSILAQGSSYAQPLAPYCAFIIQKALNDISTKAVTPDDARAAALIALTSLDNLVCAAAKQKAAATAENLGAHSREINERVRALAKRHEYAGLPGGIGVQVVDIVLSVLENPEGVTVVRYSKTSPTGTQTQGQTISMTVETRQPVMSATPTGPSIGQMTHGPTPPSPQVAPQEGFASPGGAFGFQGASGPTTSIPVRIVGRPVDITYVAVPGLAGAAVGLTSMQFFQNLDTRPKYGARFHGPLTDYTLRNVGTPQDVCITDAMVFPSAGLGYLERHIASLKEASSPAPSFNRLVSSGCKSYSDDARRLFYEHFYSNQLFSLVKQDAKANAKLQLRAQQLQAQESGKRKKTYFSVLHMWSGGQTCECLLAQSEASKDVKAQTALSTMLSLWTAKPQKRAKENRLPEGIATAMEDYSNALERYANMLSHSPDTRNVYNLAAHTWVQLRGIHNAAEGFLPGKGAKISERNKQVAAVFSKLWFEADPAFVQTPGSLLKPFPGLMASVALQVAFFLHSVVGEYKAGIWKQMGVAVKSFFVGLFRRNKRMKVPSSWKQVEARAHPAPRTDVRGFQGLLHTIRQLAKSFHDRFLKPAMAVHDSSPLLPSYIAFIHGLVAQWMNPYGGKFSIDDPHISKAKKLFYYSVFIHPQGLTYVAAELIRAGCKGIKRIDVGKVRATVEHSGKRQAVGTTILRQKPVPIKGSTLEYHLNMLLATYDDPFDIIRVAQDLATRCQTGAGSTGSNSFLEQDANAEGSGANKGFSFPKIGFLKSKKKEEETTVEASARSSDDSSQSGDGAKEKRGFKIPSVGFSTPDDTEGETKLRSFSIPSIGFSKPTTTESETEQRSDATGENIMSSKFVVDTWCLKYKDFVARTLTEVPKTTNSEKLSLLLEEALDTITEIVLTSATSETSWVLNLKCPFMRDFIDAEMRLRTRRAMLHYAISRRGIGKRLRRKLRAIKNWFTKKFTWKRRRKPGLKADNEWAVIHAGTSTWDPQRKRFEHALTFRPESMTCSSQQRPTKVMDFRDDKFDIRIMGANASNDAVLCVKDDVYCWATRRALMFKGSTEAPISHTEQPAGLWYSRLPGVSAPSPKGPQP